MDKIKEFWKNFLKESGRNLETKYLEAFHFELTEYLANYLLELVLSGQKKATCSSLLVYELENERVPQVGDLSIITDWDGLPKCVIETVAVTTLPFKDITYDICKREGEDDTLESWQKGHIRFFEEDGKKLGYKFTWDMPVVFEDFKVIYKV